MSDIVNAIETGWKASEGLVDSTLERIELMKMNTEKGGVVEREFFSLSLFVRIFCILGEHMICGSSHRRQASV